MKSFLIVILGCFFLYASGNEPEGNIYWVQFNTKTGTPYSINQPQKFLSNKALERRNKQHIDIDSTDLPVNPLFTDSLRSMGFYIKHTSRWMNGAIVIQSNTESLNSLELPSFVSYIQLRKDAPQKSQSTKINKFDSLTISSYGNSMEQITMLNGHLLHSFSKGEGVQVAIIDAGFYNADIIEPFAHLYKRNGILGTYDFVSPGNNVYLENSHGTNVLSIMAAYTPGSMIGSAPNAMYWLLRSEDSPTESPTESPVEEDYWVVAAEFADSVGCNVINTSLGYTIFDNPAFDHNYGEFTGDSLRISKAANLAIKKGIVVVCSAGNDGNNPWHYIAAPSEAKDVLSVAAVDGLKELAGFSSRGFGESASVLKPDVAAMGLGTAIVSSNGNFTFGNGTSFSSPVIAGMAACLVSLFPNSSAYAIIDMIRKAGNLFPMHSSDFGYGIPDFGKYIDSISVGKTQLSDSDKVVIYPNPFTNFISVSNPNLIDKIQLRTLDGQLKFTALRGDPAIYGINTEKLEALSRGIYLANIWSNNNYQTIKLIKK